MDNLDWLSRITIRKPVPRISDADVDALVAQVRRQHARWVAARRVAKIGDRVSLTYSISHKGRVVESREAESLAVIVGSKAFHPTIEKRVLVGAKAGERLQATGKHPGDSSTDPLAGKRVRYAIDVLDVERPVLPRLDTSFAKALGLKGGGRKTIRNEIRKIMQREADLVTKRVVREQVLSGLLSRYPAPPDANAVASEAMARAGQAGQAAGAKTSGDARVSGNAVSVDDDIAKLSLILRDIVRMNRLSIDTERLMVVAKALALREADPGAAMQRFFESFETRSRIESELLEDQAIDFLVSRMRVKEERLDYSRFMASEGGSPSRLRFAGRPVIQFRRENKCSYCARSKCCHYISQKIVTPRSKSDFSHLLWQVSHKNVEIFRDDDGWFLLINSGCAHLQDDGRCGIYAERPEICRSYSVDNCEFAGPADRDLHFTDHATLLRFCRERFKKWDSAG
jgi:FKBP-type peptidyl-prolyl cis-trans isomerase (trigger factor)/Fe-S-cluster containining protein